MIGSALPSQNSLPAQRRFGQPHRQWFVTCWMLIGLLSISFTGCRQRAVTELYVEQMAQRNRALEDLVYDFDAENRSMEFEIEDLRRTNAQLQGRLQEIQRQSSRIDNASPSDRPSTTLPDSIKRDFVRPETVRPETVRPETVRPETVRPETSKSKNASPAPLKLPPGRSKDDASLILELPEIVVPIPLTEPILPAPEPLAPKSQVPEPLAPEPQIREQLPEATLPEVPAIEKGSMLEPAPRGLPTSGTDASLLDRKIQLPASAAPSGSRPVIQTSAVQAAAARAALGPPPSKPVDYRVREIDWHPTMCRAQNSDGKPGDDGLYLVLVPRNSAGQFVPSVGALTLVVEETLADGSVARIGRYEFSEAELKDHLEPVGSAPGLHIPIRWTEQKPISTSVEVYAKLTMPDGTTMVNRRTIPLRKLASSGSSTWTPR